jgi:hypothetical protein
MNKIPLIIIFTKPTVPKYETVTFICDSLEECYNKLIINIKNKISKIIDYPEDLDNFASLYWYKDYNMDNEIFDYNIFYENEWKKPWSNQELYENIINIIHDVDVQNKILYKDEED